MQFFLSLHFKRFWLCRFSLHYITKGFSYAVFPYLFSIQKWVLVMPFPPYLFSIQKWVFAMPFFPFTVKVGFGYAVFLLFIFTTKLGFGYTVFPLIIFTIKVGIGHVIFFYLYFIKKGFWFCCFPLELYMVTKQGLGLCRFFLLKEYLVLLFLFSTFSFISK